MERPRTSSCLYLFTYAKHTTTTPTGVLPPPVAQWQPGHVILSPPPRSQLPVIEVESIDDEILYLSDLP